MHTHRFALLPAVMLATVALGQGPSRSAHADFINSQNDKIGTAALTQPPSGVKIDVDIAHLPAGTHAFHIHAVGKSEAPDFKSAGGHFNPEGKQHGKDNPNGMHAGDMLNFEVAADGAAKFSVTNAGVTLENRSNSLVNVGGTALVIHEKADDYRTDPTGNAGNRIACGAIVK